MKKILLATTVLAGTAGFAAAEGVTLSGYAEMGFMDAGNGDLQFHQDVEVKFKMSGTTDGGLEFGAVIDLDETNVAFGDDSGTTVYVKGAFGTLTMGDTDGALDWAVADAGALTSIADDHTTHIAYFHANGMDGQGDGQVLRYDYSFGSFGVAVSFEQAANGASVAADDIFGLGLKYSADMGGTAVNFGVGYQTGNVGGVNGDMIGVSVGADVAGLTATLGYIDTSLDGAGNDYSSAGLGLTYTTGALSLHANYGVIDPEGAANIDSFGLAANYDLGGGAVVMAGYGSDVNGLGDDVFSLGLGMSF